MFEISNRALSREIVDPRLRDFIGFIVVKDVTSPEWPGNALTLSRVLISEKVARTNSDMPVKLHYSPGLLMHEVIEIKQQVGTFCK